MIINSEKYHPFHHSNERPLFKCACEYVVRTGTMDRLQHILRRSYLKLAFFVNVELNLVVGGLAVEMREFMYCLALCVV